MKNADLPAPAIQRHWWVNQNQTFRQEIDGGYQWSPKRKANNHRNAFYEFMREVAPGDIVFSFKDTLIQAVGVAADFCFEAPKPTEFGATGSNWNRVGWKVPVHWTHVDRAEHLVASHCKSWRECANAYERLDGENGLMLTPTIDHLFDRGFISFENNGELLISPVADLVSLDKMQPRHTVFINPLHAGKVQYAPHYF